MAVTVEIDDLIKSFGARAALDGVSLRVEEGELVALVGPNGAGKTTLLRILATLSKPTSGAVLIDGMDVRKDNAELRRRIGFLSHRTLLYDDLTAGQNLRFYARMYDLKEPEERIEELLERVNLAERQHDPVSTFSRGMQQRLAVARTLLHKPRLLLLDEPYSGLDAQATSTLSGLLVELTGEGRTTIILTTHDLRVGLALARRVVVLANGRVRQDVPRQEIGDLDSFERHYQAITG